MMPSVYQVACILVLVCADAVRSMPFIERRPTNVTVRHGKNALFECRVRDARGVDVMWLIASSGAIISRNTQILTGVTPTAGQYLIEGDAKRGDYNLNITNVQRNDAEEYLCGYPNTNGDLVSVSAFLEVLLPPAQNSPACSVKPSNTTLTVGDTVHLMCLSRGGVPPADLTWYKNGVSLSDGHHGINDLERVLDLSDMKAEYECRAESPAITQARNCTTSIKLPSPMVIIQPYNQKAEVGESVTFMCIRQDKPTEHRFMWFFKGERITSSSPQRFIISDYNRALTIKNITAADSGSVTNCVVSVLPEPYTGTAYLMVSIMTGEVLGTLPPPKLRTESPAGHESSSTGRRGGHDVSSPGMSVGVNEKESRDKTAMFVILGACGGLFIVISAVVINFVVIRRKKNTKDQPKPKANVKHVGSRLSMMTTKPSDKSLSSTDSVSTTKTTVTTVTAPCSKGDAHLKANKKDGKRDGCQYAALDSNGLRTSEYQGLNAPPMTIYAEPIITPTRLVPRPQQQDGFHDYALPDILPELETTPEEYVEPDPPPLPRDRTQTQENQKPKTKEAPKLEEKVLSNQSPDGVYIEIIE